MEIDMIEYTVQVYPNGNKCWFLEDMELTEAEFNLRMNPVKELTVAEISIIRGYKVKIVK